AAICMGEAPRVTAWVDVVDDLSGLRVEDEGFLARDVAKPVLGELLTEIGRVYVPALLANAKALMSGKDKMETVIDGRAWAQPTFPYQGKCLQWIRKEYKTLSDEDRAWVDTILEGTGCELLFED
ncbi:MAG: glutathione S-transferase, partial [Proteobacteria bacterium]|nr:glutathione S-transferase [Pseudomonadota bacterium]